MNFETWLAYVFACTVLSIIPGPSVLLVTGQTLTKGLKGAVVCLAGETLGGTVLILMSLLGVGAILATSAILFTVVKWLGILYLAYLGVREILKAKRIPNYSDENHKAPTGYRGSFSAGFFTALLNPKAIVFYMAFLSPFIDPEAHLIVQYSVLIVTSITVAGIVLFGYALVASRAQHALKSQRAKRNVGYASGGFYLGGSALMAISR